MSPRTAWLMRGGLLTIPYLALLGLGGLWLWERGWALAFVAATAVLTLAVWGAQRWSNRKRVEAVSRERLRSEHVPPDQNWPPLGRAAWDDLQTYADSLNADDFAWDDPRAWWGLFHDSVGRVAGKFHSRSGDPMLEVPVPQVLRIVELVARDLRRAVATQVPGSHVLTVNDLRRIKAAAEWLPALSRLYRVGSFVLNPAAGLAREVANYAQGMVMSSTTTELKRWLLRFLVRQTGFYAIELYSGRLAFDPELNGIDSPRSPGDYAPSSAAPLGNEPRSEVAAVGTAPRMLVVGQVKAGKSSLINALFGEVRAVSDALPATAALTEYRVQLGPSDTSDGANRAEAVILDSPGYDDVNMGKTTWQLVRDKLLDCDAVILVVSATSAARASDRKMLDEIRELFAKHPVRHPPVVLVALTHVDLLRPFTEWEPPYDIVQPKGAKGRNIREAVDTIAADLGIEPADAIPVCLRPDRIDNVREGLVPALLGRLPEARRVACLRVFKEQLAAQEWSLWRTQAENAGRILAKLGMGAASGLASEARAAADRLLFGKPSKKD
jgi:predicted GTPase